MKHFFYSIGTVLCLLCVGTTLHATSMTLPALDASQLSDATTEMPPELRDQFSREELASQSTQALAKRNIELRDRLNSEPTNPALLHELGTVIFQQGGTKEAKALWTVAHKKEPNLAPPEVMAAVQEVFRWMSKGDKTEAGKQLAANEQRFANDPYFQLIKAEQAMRSHNFAMAEKAYVEAHKLGPKLYVTALNLGRFYAFNKREPAQITKLYQIAIKLAPQKPEVWQALGTYQFEQKQENSALESFRKARQLAPESPLPERRLGKLSLASGDVNGAERWYLAALKSTLSPKEELEVHAEFSNVLLSLGKFKEARREIEAVLLKQEAPPLVFALATIDEMEGNFRQAEKGYRRVLELLPDNPLATNNLAMLLLRTDGSAQEGRALAEQARKTLPNNRIIEGTYGCALVQSGATQEGVSILEKVILSGNNLDAWTYFFLAKGLVALSRPDEAKVYFAKVIAVDSAFPKKEEVERQLGKRL